MRKTFIGEVVSDKMAKTVVVLVKRRKKHPLYRKIVEKRKKFYAENLKGAKTGDTVKIAETRPLSKLKRFEVLEIIKKAKIRE